MTYPECLDAVAKSKGFDGFGYAYRMNKEFVLGDSVFFEIFSEAATMFAEQDIDKQLVSFGNYLFSSERMELTSLENQFYVTHADLANWRYKQLQSPLKQDK